MNKREDIFRWVNPGCSLCGRRPAIRCWEVVRAYGRAYSRRTAECIRVARGGE